MSTAVGLVKDKPVHLNREIAPDLPCVRADPLKVRQILLNLLSNASKFTEEGSITVQACFQVRPAGTDWPNESGRQRPADDKAIDGIRSEDQCDRYRAGYCTSRTRPNCSSHSHR